MSAEENPLIKPAQEILTKMVDSTVNNFVNNTVATSLQTIQQQITPKGFMRRLSYKEQRKPK